MIYGIDPWFLAALVVWSAVAPVGALILGWQARGRTERRHHTHTRSVGPETSAEHWSE